MRTLHVLHSAASLMLLATPGCGPAVHSGLERAAASVQAAQRDPAVVNYAPLALGEAEDELQRAQRVWREDGDWNETEHLAFLAGQKAAIAQLNAKTELAERRRAEESRSRETARARMQAEYFRDEAEAANERAAALARELSEFKARRTQRGLELTISDVVFEFNKAELKPGASRKLAPLAEFARAEPQARIEIEGHTDSVGSPGYNRVLSEERAQAVRSVLVSEGVDPSRIIARGMGEHFPVAPNDTPAGRLQNRRVEVVVSNAPPA